MSALLCTLHKNIHSSELLKIRKITLGGACVRREVHDSSYCGCTEDAIEDSDTRFEFMTS